MSSPSAWESHRERRGCSSRASRGPRLLKPAPGYGTHVVLRLVPSAKAVSLSPGTRVGGGPGGPRRGEAAPEEEAALHK